jgi:hypothetical protein
MGSEVTTIPQLRRVIYDTYGNFPTTNLREGDLAYATDRLVLYRWSGAAWQAITIHCSSGVAANIPNAANLPNGSIYYETDTNIMKQVQSGAWGAITVPVTTGSFTGDNTANRAIPHGLGIIPKIVFIYDESGALRTYVLRQNRANIMYQRNDSFGSQSVTGLTSTNFYVGNAASYPDSANENTRIYQWVAFG